MNRLSSSLSAICVLILAFAMRARCEDETPPLRIGLVNVKEIFSGYKVAKGFEAQMQTDKTAAQAEISAIEAQMKDLMGEIQILEAGGALRLEKEEKLLELDTLRKFRSEKWKSATLARINENTSRIYNAIRDEVDAYAHENGYALILKSEGPRLEDDSTESANKRINMRTVLYGATGLDITQAILDRLNSKAGR